MVTKKASTATRGCRPQDRTVMTYRIRETMKQVGVEPIGVAGKAVELDETMFGFQDGMNAKLAKQTPLRAVLHASTQSDPALKTESPLSAFAIASADSGVYPPQHLA